MRFRAQVIIWSVLISAAASAQASLFEFIFRLNGREYPMEVAAPHVPLPQLSEDQQELLRTITDKDVLEYSVRNVTVTGRVVEASRLVCSDGSEMTIGEETIQQLFQLMAETYIILHTPQVPGQLPPNNSTTGQMNVEERLIISPSYKIKE